MYIYDSVKKTKLPFEPIRPNKASIYVCGPTVYDDAHLGHARSSLAFDLLSRTLSAHGYEVTLAKNFTDIDDKIIKKVEATGKSMEEITSFYIKRYTEEMEALSIKRADIEPKATESLVAIEAMIQNLINKDIAYVISTGDVYFDTSKDATYGNISHRVADDDVSQSRVEHTSEKRNPKDFALWKTCKGEDDICFDTAFSRGRPGWHIECSAMIKKHFTGTDEYSIDIHGGGADLLFPHHENEAAQSRCATGHELSKYWMHNGFVQIDGEKMSKSLGNSFFLKDALKLYDGEVLRYYLNSVHYRNDFNFSEVELQLSKKRLDKLYRLKKRVSPAKTSLPNKNFKKSLLAAMGDDLNISMALAHIDELIATTNDALDDNPKDKSLKKETLANLEFIDTLLGFGRKEPFSYFQIGVDEALKAQIDTLITERLKAKKEKDFTTSDAIRDKFLNRGINIMDNSDGMLWEPDNLFRHQNYLLSNFSKEKNISITPSIFPTAWINNKNWIYIHHIDTSNTEGKILTGQENTLLGNEWKNSITSLDNTENIIDLTKKSGMGTLIISVRDYFNELSEVKFGTYQSFNAVYTYDLDTQTFNLI